MGAFEWCQSSSPHCSLIHTRYYNCAVPASGRFLWHCLFMLLDQREVTASESCPVPKRKHKAQLAPFSQQAVRGEERVGDNCLLAALAASNPVQTASLQLSTSPQASARQRLVLVRAISIFISTHPHLCECNLNPKPSTLNPRQ